MNVPFWYLNWRSDLEKQGLENELRIRLSALADQWNCTPRQARRRLQALHASGRIHYRSGQGRGNVTQLDFRLSLSQEIKVVTERLLVQEDLQAVRRLLRLPLPTELRNSVQKQLLGTFGWQRPRPGRDELRLLERSFPGKIHPHHIWTNFESHIISQLSDPLLRYDLAEARVVSHLAHHWTSENERVWTVHLRKGVLFHHGRDLTAKDVAHTYSWFQNSEANLGFLLSDLDRVEILDPYILRIHLQQPNAFFPHFMAHYALGILPHDLPFDDRQWIASGPFRLVTRTDDMMRFEAHEHYFLGRSHLDAVELIRDPELLQASISDQPVPQATDHAVNPGAVFLMATGRPGSPLLNRDVRLAVASLFQPKEIWTDLGRDPNTLVHATSFSPAWSAAYPERVYPAEMVFQGIPPIQLAYLAKPHYREVLEWVVERAARFGLTLELMPWRYNEAPRELPDLLYSVEIASGDETLALISAFKDQHMPFIWWPTEVHNLINRELRKFFSNSGNPQILRHLEQQLVREGWLTFIHHRISGFRADPLLQDAVLTSFGYPDWRKLWMKHPSESVD